MKTSTYFALMAEFGAGQVELVKICEKYLGLIPKESCRRAVLNKLPVPVFRTGSQKSPWLVSLQDLAEHIESRLNVARRESEKSQSASEMAHGTASPV